MAYTNRSNWHVSLLISGVLCSLFTVGCGGSDPPVEDSRGEEQRTVNSPQLSALVKPWNAQSEIPWDIAKVLGHLSKAAYLDEQEANAEFLALGFDRTSSFVSGSMVAYAVQSGPLLVVVFRGTDDIDDWIVNLKASSTDVSGGKMHKGFRDAYHTLSPAIQEAVQDAQPKYLWITGHSLGGALAVVCTHDFLEENIGVHGLMTFGQPMVVQSELAAYLQLQLSTKYERFINGADVVPRVPPHFTHFGSFVWFQQDGATHTTPRAEERSNGVRTLQTPPVGPPPLEEKEFKELQEKLRKLKPSTKAPTELHTRLAFPPIDDHGMNRYLQKIDARGEATAADQERPGELPAEPSQLPETRPGPPQRPLIKGPPVKKPGPPRLP